jgi:hypothetical protein
MESDSRKKENTKKSGSDNEDPAPIGYVFQPYGLRHSILHNTKVDQILLDYNFTFLPCVCIVLWCILLLTA